MNLLFIFCVGGKGDEKELFMGFKVVQIFRSRRRLGFKMFIGNLGELLFCGLNFFEIKIFIGWVLKFFIMSNVVQDFINQMLMGV